MPKPVKDSRNLAKGGPLPFRLITFISPLIVIAVGTLVLFPIFYNAPLLGWDWLFAFVDRTPSEIYTPWIDWVLYPARVLPWRTGFAVSNALTVMAVSVATLREGRSWWKYLGIVFALVNPPIWFILWDGQVDGWGLIGLMTMPVGVPLLLIKPTLIAFAVFSRKRWIYVAVIFILASFLVWGLWPIQLIRTLEHRVGHPIPMGWSIQGPYLIVIGLVLFLFTNRKDPYQHMAMGAFLHPFVMPYHYVVLLPVLGRLTYIRQLLAWSLSWLLFLEIGLIGIWRDIAYLFPLGVWLFLHQEGWFESTWLHSGLSPNVRTKLTSIFGNQA